jgi:Pyruvate/2-oxoacid:ferredoxin oxidoreductase delta subunit
MERPSRARLTNGELHSRARLSCAAFDVDDESAIQCRLCRAFCANSIFMYHDDAYCSSACRRHAMQPPPMRANSPSDDEPELSDF